MSSVYADQYTRCIIFHTLGSLCVDTADTEPCPEVDLGGGGPAWRSHTQLGGSGGMLSREILNIYIEMIPCSAL